MKKRFMVMLAAMMIVGGWGLTDTVVSAQQKERRFVVVASPAAYEAGKKWVSFLQSETVPVKHVLPGDFEAYKKEKYIAILGTPSEPGGGGDIVSSLLTKEEKDWVSQQGNRKLFIKNDVWQKDQTIFVFAAYSQDAITSAIRESRDTWWDTIMSWFDIEVQPAKLRGY